MVRTYSIVSSHVGIMASFVNVSLLVGLLVSRSTILTQIQIYRTDCLEI